MSDTTPPGSDAHLEVVGMLRQRCQEQDYLHAASLGNQLQLQKAYSGLAGLT